MFQKIFNKLSYTREPSSVFNDFLDFIIDQFLINPKLSYFNKNKYTDEDCKLFFELFKELIKTQEKELKTAEWYDSIGLFYEECVKSSMKAKNTGQFFTPADVCSLMAELNINSISADKEAILDVNDPCCGSGRLLLAHHHLRPKDLLHGADLDLTSCKMTIINYILHGVRGSVNHMNTLTTEWFNGWKINEFIEYGTPFTIMECNSENDTQIFIGHHRTENKKVSENSERKFVNINKTIQTTLFDSIN